LADTKCNNGIVGLFCINYGCYYNSDCFDGYCNMYSKCDLRPRPAYMTDLENQLSNAVDGLSANATADNSTATADDASAQVAPTNGTQPAGAANQTAGQGVAKPDKKAMDALAKEHFKESPFADSDQLNKFLLWFGFISAVLIMAFIIQCCREIAKGDDSAPMAASHEAHKSSQMRSIHDDPMTRMGSADPRSLLSPGQLTEDRAFKNSAYLMHTKGKSSAMGRRTSAGRQHQ
jgi:hypothetical protein